MLVGDHADLHQESDDDGLPGERKAFFVFVPSGRSKRVTRLVRAFLPEGDKHHQFDTQELSHRPDGSQLLFQSLVQQHQTVHGKLGREEEPDVGFWKTKNL